MSFGKTFFEELQKVADASSRFSRALKSFSLGTGVRNSVAGTIKKTRQSDSPAVRAAGRMLKGTHMLAPVAGMAVPMVGAQPLVTAAAGAPHYVKGYQLEKRLMANRSAAQVRKTQLRRRRLKLQAMK